jgi:hypothetical protein
VDQCERCGGERGDVCVQVSSTRIGGRAKGKALDGYAYGPTFSFDYEKKRKKRRSREEK